ncbi:hypothetical protein AXX17_AT4G11560 [Arabidopsis thaliana]|uniref:Uncharacterized protein n=1 Tax=Arabidopsis thaliana TaxID=3702 RepID=A0A178UTC3_ARATH|nr:hypothetical protein AXX17_AT4G11560 [Arabidopsis thaliana]
MGCLREKLGEQGCIDLGIPSSSTMKEVMSMTRRRNHRKGILIRVEEEIRKQKLNGKLNDHDIDLLKGKNECSWSQLRLAKPPMEGQNEIWFPYATPKYNNTVVKNRVATGERMRKWNYMGRPNKGNFLGQILGELDRGYEDFI